MVSTTSKEAYHSIYGKLGLTQKQVYEAIVEKGIVSNDDLADYLQLPLSSICGRVNELCKFGMVGAESTKIGKYGHRVTTWSARDDNQLLRMIRECGI